MKVSCFKNFPQWNAPVTYNEIMIFLCKWLTSWTPWTAQYFQPKKREMYIFLTFERKTAQQAGSLLSLDVFHLTGIQTLIPTGRVGQRQLQGHVGALQAGQHCMRQGPPLQLQGATGLHRRNLLRLWDVGHTEPGEVAIDQPVCLTPQNHMVLL